jgi:hypothetical protein
MNNKRKKEKKLNEFLVQKRLKGIENLFHEIATEFFSQIWGKCGHLCMGNITALNRCDWKKTLSMPFYR